MEEVPETEVLKRGAAVILEHVRKLGDRPGGDPLDLGAGARAVVPQADQLGDLGHREAQIARA